MIPNLSMYSTEALIQELFKRGDLPYHYDDIYDLEVMTYVSMVESGIGGESESIEVKLEDL